jgi:hypothetical protein
MIPKTLGNLETGIPIGVAVDEESYEPKDDQYYPLANAENGLEMQDMEDSVSNHEKVRGFEDSKDSRR